MNHGMQGAAPRPGDICWFINPSTILFHVYYIYII